MQRIMIVSDTHRRHGNLAEAIYNEGHLDMLIHLGDVEGEEEVIKSYAFCHLQGGRPHPYAGSVPIFYTMALQGRLAGGP